MSNFKLINLNHDVDRNKKDLIPNKLLKFADLIYDKYEIPKIIKNNNKTTLHNYRKLNRLLLINLYNGYKTDSCIRYSRSYWFYKDNKLIVIKKKFNLYGYNSIIKLIDFYEKKNLIINKIGFFDKKDHTKNILSRMSPSKLLIQEFENINIIDYIFPQYTENLTDELIIVRKQHKRNKNNLKIKGKILQDIKELKTPKESICKLKKRIMKNKDQLYIINKKILNSEFKILNISEIKEDKYKHLIHKHYTSENKFYFKLSPILFLNKRIFNNSSLIQGGRIYNNFQLFQSNNRQNLIINGDNIQSLDLAGSHIRMLYNIENKNIPVDKDIYNIKYSNDINYNKFLRKITKKIIMILLNSKSQYHTNKLVSIEIIKEFQKIYTVTKQEISDCGYLNKQDINVWITEVINSFKEIEKYFFTGVGLRLQYIEGELLQHVIYKLITHYDVLTIPIHDELLVSENHIDYAIKYLDYKYKDFGIFNGYSPIIKVK